MFIIASTGRCGTFALCHGLDQFSDHTVEHEPEPRLLDEAYRKHRGQAYKTPVLEERLRFFRQRGQEAYGQSFRAPTLLPEIWAVAPETRFLILVRNPLDYIVSAHHKQVLRKNDVWDKTRILPEPSEWNADQASLAEKLAWHWVVVNRYLLDFACTTGASVRVAVLNRLEHDIESWAGFLGVTITDPRGLQQFLMTQPNASDKTEYPEGYDAARLAPIYDKVWTQAQKLAEAPLIARRSVAVGA